MIIKFMFSKSVQNSKEILRFIKEFDSDLGTVFGNGDRNIIKLFELDGKTINIKSFKIPHLVNKIAYKYFRKSKARRSYKYATILLEKGIEFLDHSPGNTLIKKNLEGNYDFFLVDLNRMNFHDSMDFDSRMKNLSHLTPKKEMIAVMSNEYSKLYPAQSEAEIFEKMWFYTNDFQERFAKKRRLKKKLKFWKS